MDLKRGSKLFVRIDYKNGEKSVSHQVIKEHMDYVRSIAGERYFLGGAFKNVDGGMILTEAESMEEARKIFDNDPLIQKGFYRCDIFEWELEVLSEQGQGRH